MNQNNIQNQNGLQGQFQNNNGTQLNNQTQVPIGQQIYQGTQQQGVQIMQGVQQGQQQGVQMVQGVQQGQQQGFQQQQVTPAAPAGPRQISPEEVLQVQNPKQYQQQQQQQQQMTQQELQRTQVLNIDELEKTVRFEKISSKKPAIIVAAIGILFLTFGTTFQVASNLKGSSKVEKRDIAEEVVEKNDVKPATTNLNCNIAATNQADGTDTVYSILYTFEDNKLVGFKKVYTITPTPGNPLGAATVQNYIIGYQPFLNPIEGYQISVIPTGEGLVVTVEVDYTKLDLTLLNPTQQNHFTTKLDYPLETAKEKIQTDMVTNGLICE